ncbi:MAG: HNH endonuclease [Chloroflexia bacterium]|nr:HNH endonuclease [Chloroflexia bacterium]
MAALSHPYSPTTCRSQHHGSIREKEPGLRAWRKAVIARDGHRCTACGATELLEAHHISSYGEDEARRVDISNGRTLCHTCHRNLHGLKS